MKEKINEYLDGRIKKEEIEPLLEDKEYASYYEDLKQMKETLRELRADTPDFVSKLGFVERRRFIFRNSMVFASVLVLVFGIFLGRDLIIRRQLANNGVSVTREFKASPNFNVMLVEQNLIKVQIDKAYEDKLIESLSKVGNLIDINKETSTYTFEMNGSNISDFLNVIKENRNASIIEESITNKTFDPNSKVKIQLIVEVK